MLNWCKKYLGWKQIVAVGVIVYLFVFNDNSIVQIYDHEREIARIEREIKSNEDTLAYYTMMNARLDTDPQTLERIVREQYHMQKPGEDIYLIDE